MKKSVLLTAFMLALCWSCIQSVNAQTTPNPAVPEFSAKYVSASCSEGTLVENSSLVITITNQAFEQFTYRNGFTASVYYDIKIGYTFGSDNLSAEIDCYPAESNSNYTTLILPCINNTLSTPLTFLTAQKTVEIASPVTIQVREKIGYITPDIKSYPKTAFIFTGESSGWSDTQTISLSDVSALPAPSVPEVSLPLILSLVLCLFSIAVILRRLKSNSKRSTVTIQRH
jgi:hypothetical protein